MNIYDLNRQAACKGHEPALWDAKTETDAQKALDICRMCPVPKLCLAIVKPARSFFDGVAGGKVWMNGRPVKHILKPEKE